MSNEKKTSREKAIAIIELLSKYDLDDILAVAEKISPFVPIPCFKKIVKLLRLLCKFVPTFKKISPALIKMLEKDDNCAETTLITAER